MANRLALESSPYLLQHAGNPVDWYPWGDDAFARARTEDRPIFLSVGYSTCHWCHVMEHESFESVEIAAVLNEHFVPIKVDREERPDVDRVYMVFVQTTTGAGGWPMSVWLTPDLKPFFGGTYFPPTARWGRPGFKEILIEIARAWREERPRVVESADRLLERLASMTEGRPGPGALEVAGPVALDQAVDQLAAQFDDRHGGFGGAPKFPRPAELMFLLHEYARSGREAARSMALATLRGMAAGGMRDHIGGGFHRYSVDAAWRVPHFEKMLYDQAQLVIAYLDAAQLTGEAFYYAVADDTLRYVARDLTDPAGGFYSAEDADSIPPESAKEESAHKSEGAFFLWTAREVDDLLGPDAEVVKQRFGIEPDGNAPSDPQGEFHGKSILYVSQPVEAIAARTGRSPEDIVSLLASARRVLFEARSTRPRPGLDDKILTAWNGLMIAAFARAARVAEGQDSAGLAAAEFSIAARRAAAFLKTALWDPGSRRLRRRSRHGQVAIDAYCEDYAFLVWGLLELFQATGEAEWLEWAIELHGVQNDVFWDEQDGAWFSTSGQDRSVLLRLKEDYDGAEPAASSVGALNALTLGRLLADKAEVTRAERVLGRFGPAIGEHSRAVPFLMATLVHLHVPARQVVLVGHRDADDTRSLRRVLARRFSPFITLLPVAPGAGERLSDLGLPIQGMSMRDGRATAYVCHDFVCEAPVSDPETLEQQLGPLR